MNSLGGRLYRQPHLHGLAKFIPYGGKRRDQVKAFMSEQRR
jgi:hypothetical protein